MRFSIIRFSFLLPRQNFGGKEDGSDQNRLLFNRNSSLSRQTKLLIETKTRRVGYLPYLASNHPHLYYIRAKILIFFEGQYFIYLWPLLQKISYICIQTTNVLGKSKKQINGKMHLVDKSREEYAQRPDL